MEVVTQLQLILKHLQHAKVKIKATMTLQYKDNVKYNTQQCLFHVTAFFICDDLGSVRRSARDMYQYVLKGACKGSSK